jgi:hypothetical protein
LLAAQQSAKNYWVQAKQTETELLSQLQATQSQLNQCKGTEKK